MYGATLRYLEMNLNLFREGGDASAARSDGGESRDLSLFFHGPTPFAWQLPRPRVGKSAGYGAKWKIISRM